MVTSQLDKELTFRYIQKDPFNISSIFALLIEKETSPLLLSVQTFLN
jgi:hypothetical protein